MRSPGPVVGVELRPPRSGLVAGPAMDTWIDLGHAARSLSRRAAFVLLTDSAVGDAEEENLRHLAANLSEEIDASRLIPFLTCMHSLEYCLLFAERALRHGVETLTVVGGDVNEGAERCLPHADLLRQRIRSRQPGLTLGGWVNPHRDPARQADYLLERDFAADYYLTQVVSHHHAPAIDGWLDETSRRGIDLPGAWGVFYYRSGRPEALRRLARHFAVPVDAIATEFASGASAAEVCARSIVTLREAGAENVYVCNLGTRGGARRLEEVLSRVDELSG
ncbi:MAG: hypothetical protein ACR2GQ_09385 [Gemmatimonadota bacterium]